MVPTMLNSMKRIWPWILGVLLTAVCFSLALWPRQQHSAFWSKCQNVSVGMNSIQVGGILGSPSDECHPGNTLGDHIYAWDEGDEHMTVKCNVFGVVQITKFETNAPNEPLDPSRQSPLPRFERDDTETNAFWWPDRPAGMRDNAGQGDGWSSSLNPLDLENTTMLWEVGLCCFMLGMLVASGLNAYINALRGAVNKLTPDQQARYRAALRARAPAWCFYTLVVLCFVGPVLVWVPLIVIDSSSQAVSRNFRLGIFFWFAMMAPFALFAAWRMRRIHREELARNSEPAVGPGSSGEAQQGVT